MPEAEGRAPPPRTPPPRLSGRVRNQALGLLALCISVAVVMLAVFVPHSAPGEPVRATTARQLPPTPPATTTTAPSAPQAVVSSTTEVTLPSSTTAPDRGVGAAGPSSTTTTSTTIVPIPTTTTTTMAPGTAVTTPPPTTSPPHVGSQSWSGNLAPPYTSATYDVTVTAGEVSATATWAGTPTLVLTVSCAGAKKSATGASGLYVSVDAAAGSCAVTLAEPSGVDATVSYTLGADYPAN